MPHSLINRRTFLGGALSVGGLSLLPAFPKNLSAESTDLRLLFITDIHTNSDPRVSSALSSSVETIAQHSFDLTICGGDLIHEGLVVDKNTVTDYWKIYQDFHKEIKGEKFPIIGNHDLFLADGSKDSTGKELYLEQTKLEKTYYSFDAGGYHFLMLDSVSFNPDTKEYQGNIDPEQLEWIKEDFSKYKRETPLIVATHLPLLSVRYQISDGTTFPAPENRVVTNNREVLELFKERNLLLVLQGHLHVYEEILWNGTLFITGGAISGGWWQGDWMGTAPGFSMLSMRKQRYRSKYYTLS